jgi:hypothetical protein
MIVYGLELSEQSLQKVLVDFFMDDPNFTLHLRQGITII